MVFKRFCLVLALVCSSLALYVPSADAGGLLDFLFPAKSTGPTPAETLVAPFANQDAVVEEIDVVGRKENMSPLHLRHRTNGIITRWVQEIVPALLSYDASTYEAQYGKKITDFSKIGAEEYVGFLRNGNFLTTLKSGGYDIVGFIKDYPVILNEGPVDDRYRWLYQFNVMVTYIKSGVSDYRQTNNSDYISKEYVLTVQLGRSRGVDNEHGVLIETWKIKAVETTDK